MALKKVLAVHGDFEQKLPKVKWSQALTFFLTALDFIYKCMAIMSARPF